MDMRTPGITPIAIEWRPAATSLPDDDTLVLIALSDGDVGTGYRDGDIWRDTDAMPIKADQVTHWSHLPPPPGAEREIVTPALIPLNEQTIMILGRADFACVQTAQRLRELGHDIPRTAGGEQAAVIHLNLTMYQKHGAAWFEHTSRYLDEGRAVAAPAKHKAAA